MPQGGKIRCCDDFKRSGVNGSAGSLSKIDLPSVLSLVETARLCPDRDGNARSLCFWKADHEDAYKQLPLRREHAKYCTIIARGPDKEIYAFRPKTLLFGSNLAVTSYNAVSRVVSVLFSKFFGIPVLSYFDDFSGCAPEELGDLPLRCFEALNDFLGLRIKKEKSVYGKPIPFLGLEVEQRKHKLVITLPEDKRMSYKVGVESLLKQKSCSQIEADSIFGKLQFCESTVFGRASRIFLVPIFSQKTATAPRLYPRLARAFHWLSNFLSEPKSRTYERPHKAVDALVFSDASLSGLGAVVCLPGGKRLEFATHVPDTFLSGLQHPGENVIFTLELVAALFAAERLRGLQTPAKNIIFFVDNDASLVALIKAATKSRTGSIAAYHFWSVLGSIQVAPWLERAPSDLNIADKPSREVDRYKRAPFPKLIDPLDGI